MLDLYGFAKQGNYDQQIFYGNAGTSWQTWIKPRGVTMAHMLVIGGGSGGGAGAAGQVVLWW